MDISPYIVRKAKIIDGQFLYLLELPMNHYGIVLHDRDDSTVIKAQFELRWNNATRTFSQWVDELYESIRGKV